jgi:hypothetical protein
VTNANEVSLDEVDLWNLARCALAEEHAMFDCLCDKSPVWSKFVGGSKSLSVAISP